MTLGLVAIVKDGAADLPACLASLRPHISAWTIVDTGSTDGTQRLIRKALRGIPGKLYERPFVNFGVTRSEAFALARGTADWLLASDADMTWEIDGFEPDPAVDAYLVEMGKHTPFSYRLPLVLKGDLPWQSFGACHEYTAIPGRGYVSEATDAVRIDMGPTDRSSPEKSAFYATLLEGDYAKDPDNPRTVSYLGQTYWDLGRMDDAKAMFTRRVTMGGFEEERWYAAYQLALLEPWPERLAGLMKAWEMRPTRMEPLYLLAQELNRRDLHQAAYALLSGTPPASEDTLFVERWVWTWGLKFERSIASWWAGHVEESHALSDELLTLDLPADIREAVERNRAL